MQDLPWVQRKDTMVSSIWEGDPTKALLRLESYWISKADTVAPKGLNEELLFTVFCQELIHTIDNIRFFSPTYLFLGLSP